MISILMVLLLLGPTAAQGPRELNVPDQIQPPRVVPEGTVIPISLISPISTKHAQEGDGVYAQTIFPITADNQVVIPVDSYVRGRVVNATRPGRVSGTAELTINFHTLILPSGLTVPIFGSLGGIGGVAERRGEASVGGEATKGEDATTIATTTVAGAGVGALGGRSGTGTAIGAGAGAAAGIAQVLLSRGEDLTLERGTTLEIVLDRALEP